MYKADSIFPPLDNGIHYDSYFLQKNFWTTLTGHLPNHHSWSVSPWSVVQKEFELEPYSFWAITLLTGATYSKQSLRSLFNSLTCLGPKLLYCFQYNTQTILNIFESSRPGLCLSQSWLSTRTHFRKGYSILAEVANAIHNTVMIVKLDKIRTWSITLN